ncbi:neuroblastoma breakpoint family member 4 isoform X3 [Oryctolagus cuniculus]
MPRRGDVHRRPYSRPQSLDPGTALPAMPIRYNIVAVKLYTYVYVPGYTHFATSIDMALTLGPSLDVRVETSEQLSSQLAKSQRESKELKEKLLRAEAKAYLLAKHLQDHNCEEYEDLIESMLREKPQFLEGQLAEELLPAENLKKCGVQIQEQAQELTQLQQKLQEGRALSQLIHQNLQALLTLQDPDSCQSRQLLTELLKLTEHLVAKLSTVNQTSGNQEEPYVDSPHTSRPSLRLAQLELLNGLPKPRVGPWWPCPMDNIVEVAYDEICASVWNLQQEECFFREAGLGIGPTALDRERPSLGPALPSGPELELPRLGQFPVPCAAIAGPRWPCPAAGHVAVAYLQVCDSAWGLRREECHIFQTIDMFVGPTALDRERPSLGPALPSGPELKLPRLGQFPVPCAAIAGPRWPCPAAGHVAVAYFQVCDSAWGLRREECHIFQTIDMFGLAWLHLTVLSGHGTQGRWSNITLASGPPTVYQMYEEKVAGYLGPNKPKVCLKLPKPEQPEFLLSPVACPYPSLTMPSLVDCTCRTAGSDWGRVQVPHFCLFVSASGTLKACPQKHLNGILGCHLSKVPVSHAELWVRLQGYTCPQVPVDPQLASGSNEARRSDSSSTCSFAENIDSRNQLLLHKVPVTDGYLASNPKQDNTIEGSATSNHASQVTVHPVGSDVLRKEMIQRKFHFSKWRLSYRIPGFRLEVQRYQELLELQGPALATMKGCK